MRLVYAAATSTYCGGDMADKAASGQSWWQTVPGILTGIAALITAVTGLIVAYNRVDNRSADERPPTESVAPSLQSSPQAAPTVSRSPSSSAGTPGASIAPVSIPLPAISRVKLAGGAAVITILSAKVEPIAADRRSLTFNVRYTNAGRYPANFWSDSYRLIVDEVPRAPTQLLDEVVAGDSAKEGDVVFEVPLDVKNVVLQISSGEDKTRMPFTLP